MDLTSKAASEALAVQRKVSFEPDVWGLVQPSPWAEILQDLWMAGSKAHARTSLRSVTFPGTFSAWHLDEWAVELWSKMLDSAVAPPADELDVTDWDVHLAVAPERAAGRIRVRLKYGGKGTPSLAEDPWSEE